MTHTNMYSNTHTSLEMTRSVLRVHHEPGFPVVREVSLGVAACEREGTSTRRLRAHLLLLKVAAAVAPVLAHGSLGPDAVASAEHYGLVRRRGVGVGRADDLHDAPLRRELEKLALLVLLERPFPFALVRHQREPAAPVFAPERETEVLEPAVVHDISGWDEKVPSVRPQPRCGVNLLPEADVREVRVGRGVSDERVRPREGKGAGEKEASDGLRRVLLELLRAEVEHPFAEAQPRHNRRAQIVWQGRLPGHPDLPHHILPVRAHERLRLERVPERVRRQHRLRRRAPGELRQERLVPVWLEARVRIDLEHVLFAAPQPHREVARVRRPLRLFPVHVDLAHLRAPRLREHVFRVAGNLLLLLLLLHLELNLPHPLHKLLLLLWVLDLPELLLYKGGVDVDGNVQAINHLPVAIFARRLRLVLQAHADKHARRIGRFKKQVVERVAELRIAVRGDLHKDARRLLERRGTASADRRLTCIVHTSILRQRVVRGVEPCEILHLAALIGVIFHRELTVRRANLLLASPERQPEHIVVLLERGVEPARVRRRPLLHH
mmetsp:Transcript_26262/g.86238  ORF Transcript_26262/g.86238 Transcript_26262/m.86238 type:complete len:552 (+) Transcript_26262:36-1691(+)